MPPIHLRPTAALADRVLLPGDPGRALLLAQALLDGPKMFNHHRGLWGYTGTVADGAPLTIQSTGIGGPSAAIVITELADLGARTLVRVGTCRALREDLSLADLILVTAALAMDGTSRALGAPELVPAGQALLDRAAGGELPPGVQRGSVVSSDLFYGTPRATEMGWARAGALAVEMQTATLFTIAASRGLDAASTLLVSDPVAANGQRIEPEALQAAEQRLGELALSLLGAGTRAAFG
jgi:DeoD family purine-nucleoside phosphorylase